ncbi:histidine phosphatase family protein [Neobacillus sp. D3-1R]|uniref:histidine phosphatase family protein n=1 Tax=Neobacillus sp. D3-1R TaxID=3445778 RepID=UPI003FA02041
MKVGLLRHFNVTRGYPNKRVTSKELMEWVKEYDESDVEEREIELFSIPWKKCYSSDLPRAKKTAEKAFSGGIIYMEELREVTLSPYFKSNVKIPLFIHLLFIRMAWLFNHKSQAESKQEVMDRINRALDIILQSNENVLIVGHGGIMMFMRRELKKRGFKGQKFNRAENAKLYLFEMKNQK